MSFKIFLLESANKTEFNSYLIMSPSKLPKDHDEHKDALKNFDNNVNDVIKLLKSKGLTVGDNYTADDGVGVDLYDITVADDEFQIKQALQSAVDSFKVTFHGNIYYIEDGEQSNKGYSINVINNTVKVKSIK